MGVDLVRSLTLLLSALLVAVIVIALTCSCSQQQQESLTCTNISLETRIDCSPELSSQSLCVKRRCCWQPAKDPDAPSCFFPDNYPAYEIEECRQQVDPTASYNLTLVKRRPIYFDKSVEFDRIQCNIVQETRERLRLRFTIPNQSDRWEPKVLPEPTEEPKAPSCFDYEVHFEKRPFGIKVFRKNDTGRKALVDSTGSVSSALITSDQFLQIAFKLGTQRIFGPGEIQTKLPLKLDTWQRFGLWARDQPPIEGANLYGVHNFLIGLDDQGQAFGLFLLNSNAQETVFTPLPSVVYRTTGGILDLFLLTGPKPLDVIQQYWDLIGRPPVPPYWSLGYHLCRYGYGTLNKLRTTLERNLELGIPIDAQWIDIDYMLDGNGWTINPIKFSNLSQFVQLELHDRLGIKLVIIAEPAIGIGHKPSVNKPYLRGLELGLFINDSTTGKPIIGKAWPGDSVFADFSHPKAEDWWFDSASAFHKLVNFDGLWIDMNEPTNLIDGSLNSCSNSSRLDHPDFVPNIMQKSLYSRTICPSSFHHDTTHYNRHNLYGFDQTRVTYAVLGRLGPHKRPFVLTRSTFPGSGRYGAHWTGDNFATWHDLKASVGQLIAFNLFGIPFVGADICGFNGNSSEQLCIRWHQLGAFYPFARNHNERITHAQDPAYWSKPAVDAIRRALRLRYLLLPYLYTQFYRAQLSATPIIRALAFQYPEDTATHDIDEQFLFGPSILISPVLEPDKFHVDAYLPRGNWINLHTLEQIESVGQFFTLQAPLHRIPVLVSSGSIIPVQFDVRRTSVSRKQGLGLWIFLSHSNATASGELFWDNGISPKASFAHIRFRIDQNQLQSSVKWQLNNGRGVELEDGEDALKYVLVHGVVAKPNKCFVNGQLTELNYDNHLNAFSVRMHNYVNITNHLTMNWSF